MSSRYGEFIISPLGRFNIEILLLKIYGLQLHPLSTRGNGGATSLWGVGGFRRIEGSVRSLLRLEEAEQSLKPCFVFVCRMSQVALVPVSSDVLP